MGKVRIDQLLVSKGLIESRERAKTTVMAGLVYWGEQRIDKPGQLVAEDADIIVRGDPVGYVSRGGLKLAKALDTFCIDVTGRQALDAGASTGGFTDCLLRRGAAHVWAVDVGYGQLAWKLREDPRVTVFERTNIRYMEPHQLAGVPDFGVADVSFISLKLVLPALQRLLAPQAAAVCLIKPQFEAGREQVGKKGVVRDPEVHIEVLSRFLRYAADTGWHVKALTFSPVRGPEGNIEYLAQLGKDPVMGTLSVSAVVQDAHNNL